MSVTFPKQTVEQLTAKPARQGIVTTHDARSGTILARCDAGHLEFDWVDNLGNEGNHAAAAPTYLDTARIIGKRQGAMPPNPYRSGYGPKIPSSWELQLDDKRWRRVYVMCWSNIGTPYVLVGGKPHLLGSYDPALEGK